MRSRPAIIATLLVSLAATTACVTEAPATGSSATTIAVDSTATACELSATEATSGLISFSITNSGDDVTEFYLLAEDGQQVISELEDIGPGLTRDMIVDVAPGRYIAACKPGMTGDGIREDFTVTD